MRPRISGNEWPSRLRSQRGRPGGAPQTNGRERSPFPLGYPGSTGFLRNCRANEASNSNVNEQSEMAERRGVMNGTLAEAAGR